MPIVPDHTALFPVPPIPNPTPTNADPILSTNHEHNWYKYNNPDNLPLNGRVQAKKWVIWLPSGEEITEGQEIPDAVPVYGRLRVDKIAVQVDKDEIQAPNNGGKSPSRSGYIDICNNQTN